MKSLASIIHLCMASFIFAADVPFRVSGPGPIRSALGLCIDISSGNYLYKKDCDGTYSQQWVRPSASDYRLQVSNTNLCMDLEGGDVNAAADWVLLQTCSANKLSQQWVYDGFHIRLKYNTDLCLNIQGSAELFPGYLTASPCDDQLDNAWVEYSISSPAGTYSASDTHKHLLCPVGSRVINISGWGGFWVDQLIMTCSDGTVLGPVGDSGAGWTTSDCTTGFSGVIMTYGTAVGDAKGVVGKVEAFCRGSSSPIISIGSATNGWYGTSFYYSSGMTSSITFQSNEQIIGMESSYGGFVNYVSLLYAKRLVASTLPADQKFLIKARSTGWVLRGTLGLPPTIGQYYALEVINGICQSCSENESDQFQWNPSTSKLSLTGSTGTYCVDVGCCLNDFMAPMTNICKEIPTQQWTYDGTYIKSSKFSALCLSLDGNTTVLKSCAGGQDQMWDVSDLTPTARPSSKPTRKPSKRPSVRPSFKPTRKPSKRPSPRPSSKPTRKPSKRPSARPVAQQTSKPWRRPTSRPSVKPTAKSSTELQEPIVGEGRIFVQWALLALLGPGVLVMLATIYIFVRYR
jgi:hypothetical protein